MKAELIKQVVDLAARQSHVWLATVGADGRPHMTTAGNIFLEEGDRIVLREWFCPTTVTNAKANPAASIVVWPGGEEDGFQLLGQIEGLREHAVLDGYDPVVEGKASLPQVQREMIVRIEEVLCFRHGPHSDTPESVIC